MLAAHRNLFRWKSRFLVQGNIDFLLQMNHSLFALTWNYVPVNWILRANEWDATNKSQSPIHTHNAQTHVKHHVLPGFWHQECPNVNKTTKIRNKKQMKWKSKIVVAAPSAVCIDVVGFGVYVLIQHHHHSLRTHLLTHSLSHSLSHRLSHILNKEIIFWVGFFFYFFVLFSLSRQPSRLLTLWIKEFLAKISLLKPQFVALHLQEVGGKTYEKSMEYVQQFIEQLCESPELEHYNRIRVFLDEDYTSAEHFTVNFWMHMHTHVLMMMIMCCGVSQ